MDGRHRELRRDDKLVKKSMIYRVSTSTFRLVYISIGPIIYDHIPQNSYLWSCVV